MDLSLLGMLCSVRGGGYKPTLLFDGDVPTSSSAEYADFTIDKEYMILIVVSECNDRSRYAIGSCVVVPMHNLGENDTVISFYGNPVGTTMHGKGYIKRAGNTISVRSSNSSFAHITVYGI